MTTTHLPLRVQAEVEVTGLSGLSCKAGGCLEVIGLRHVVAVPVLPLEAFRWVGRLRSFASAYSPPYEDIIRVIYTDLIMMYPKPYSIY